MKKIVSLIAMVLMTVRVSAQLGYYNSGFVELIPDDSFIYRFVQAMDDESQKAIEDLLAGESETEYKSIINRKKGGWYVRNDYPLPEGNYYESDIYKKSHFTGNVYIILSRVHVTLKIGYLIDNLLEYYGDKVTLEKSKGEFGKEPTNHDLTFHMKTSTEVLEAIIEGYNIEPTGIRSLSPDRFDLEYDMDSDLISELKGCPGNSLKLIYENDWQGAWYRVRWEGKEPCPWETTDEGLAITANHKMDQMWSLYTKTSGDDLLSLKKGSIYLVRMTLKVPSDGTYYVGLGDLREGGNALYCQVPVVASDDFQVIDFELPKFPEAERNGSVMLGSGWVVGTTILKKVEVFDKDTSTNIQSVKTSKSTNNAIYNLAGQKVSSSYKGIVIQNKKVVIK